MSAALAPIFLHQINHLSADLQHHFRLYPCIHRMEQLPVEIVEQITNQIDDNNLRSLLVLRRVCRTLEAKVHRPFINRCFVTRRIDTSAECMQQLTNLMRFSPYASLVKNLVIDCRQKAIRELVDADVAETMLKWFSGKLLSLSHLSTKLTMIAPTSS